MAKKRYKAKQIKNISAVIPEAEKGSSSLDSLNWDIVCWCGLLLVGALLYGHTLNAPWYLDDTANIVKSARVHDLSQAFKRILDPRGPAYLSFAINFWLGGLSLPGFHITNVAIHVITSGLIYLVAKRVFPKQHVYAVIIAAIFLTHPLQTQAVTYIVQRMTSLSALFGFLCLYLYIRFREVTSVREGGKSFSSYCLWACSLLFGALAVLTKQNMAVVPLTLVLFDYFYLSGTEKTAFLNKKNLLLLLPFFLPPILIALQQLMFPLSAGVPIADISSSQIKTTPLYYLVTEFSVIWLYLKLFLIPYPQMLEYAYPVTQQLWNLQNVMAFIGLVLLLYAAVRGRKKYPHLSFGLLWFFVSLSVESTVIPLDPVFEHRMYMAIFGLGVFAAGLGYYFLPSKVAVSAALCVLIVFSALTWNRNQLWNDSLDLYLDNYKHTVPDDRLTINLTQQFILRKRYVEAIDVLTKSINEGSKHSGIYFNLASSYLKTQKFEKAVNVVKEAMALGVNNNKLRAVLAHSYEGLRDYKNAEMVYREILENKPDSPAILNDLGLVLIDMKRYEEANKVLRKGLRLDPESIPLQYSLAQSLMNLEMFSDAEKYLRRVVVADSTITDAWFLLGIIGLKSGQVDTYKEALEKLRQVNQRAAEQLLTIQEQIQD